MKMIFASNNAHKLSEIRQSLGHSFTLLSLDDVGFKEEIPETGNTLEENAMQKARTVFDRFQQPVFADDSGLEVECLGAAPGVDTAHYSGTRDAGKNIEKLLAEMQNCPNRKAKFRTVIAFIDSTSKHLFQGEIKGEIASKPSGKSGFGYDPVFIPEGSQRTFAEMTSEEKAQQSHRVRALQAFTAFLKNDY